jgi:hypothetical protein
MPAYKESFPVGSKVCIVDLNQLQDFQRIWKFHHKLSHDQLDFAGRIAVVKKIGFYHGGDVLYELHDVPGIWHEQCLCPVI